MSRPASLFCALVALGACGPTSSQPVRAMALVLDADRVYRPREVELSTLEDPVALKGSIVTTLGGVRIVDDPNDPIIARATTPEQLRKALFKSEGAPPRVSYVEKDGVLWPADFHSWNLVSGYWGMERAQRYFEGNGGPSAAAMGPIDFFYFPDFVLMAIKREPLTNNALFFSPLKAMLLLPFDENLQEAPLAINSGVLAHEWSHRVFNHTVHGGALLPEAVLRWAGADVPAAKVLFAMEEGLADFHAVAATCNEEGGCDPAFLDSSFNETFSSARDISRSNHCMTGFLRDAFVNQSLNEFRGNSLDYATGTIIASVLYQAAEISGLGDELQKAVVASYSDSSATALGFQQLIYQNLATPENVRLGTMMNAIVAHAGSLPLKNALCNEILDHLKVPREDLPACPSTTTGGLQCPSIQVEGSGE